MDHQIKVKLCSDLYVKYHTSIGQQLTDYVEIKFHIDFVRRLSELYTLKYAMGKISSEPIVDGSLIDMGIEDQLVMNSLFVNIVMSYAKCFDVARGNTGRRSIKLDKGFLKGVSISVSQSHETLMSLRHELIAHASKSIFEKHECKIGLDKTGHLVIKPGSYDGQHNSIVKSGQPVEIQEMKPLLDEIDERIVVKIKELEEKAMREIDILSQKGELVMDKLLKGEPIVNKDVM